MIQWLGLCALTAEGPGSTPGWGNYDPTSYMVQQKKEKNKTKLNLVSHFNYQIPFLLKQSIPSLYTDNKKNV